ncbi:MAG TPA: AAA family ATPase [Candidatus Desulfobacillus sp.]|nr:AAA family ATPase [Candidatus Desulfobacillus sp.]
MPSAVAPPSALDEAIHRAGRIVLGKERQIRLALACLLARGHLLIEDLPGMGKTLLAHVLARLLGLNYQRIQCTADMLPADIIGVSIYERETGAFRFHPGPVFAQLVLVDEINRATPKAQSALLEAMEERQVSCEGETRALPEPFFVMATQNPFHQAGTFPLPESQLDRFLMRIGMGYPDQAAERELLAGADRRELMASLEPCLTAGELLELQRAVQGVHVSSALIAYVQSIAEHTRRAPEYQTGLSPRAALALLRAARAWALIDRRDLVLPEDIQAVLPAVAGHRLQPSANAPAASADDVAAALIAAVPLP